MGIIEVLAIVICSLIVLGVIALAVYRKVTGKSKGCGCGCSCGCSHCTGKCTSAKDNSSKTN